MNKQEQEIKMLPCPFCGGEPEIEQTGKNQLKLKCKSCLIGITQKTLRFSLDWLKEKMIESWNERTQSLPQEVVEQLYKWVKASDELPEKNKNIPTRLDKEDEYLIMAFYDGKVFWESNHSKRTTYREVFEIEWLKSVQSLPQEVKPDEDITLTYKNYCGQGRTLEEAVNLLGEIIEYKTQSGVKPDKNK